MPEENSSSRHHLWLAVATFSAVSVSALMTEIDDGQDLEDQSQEYKWSVSAASISLGLSTLAWFAHVAKDRFVGTPIEGGLALLVFAVWAAGLPVMMETDEGIAASIGGGILNANLYFFSWAASAMSLILLVQYVRDVHVKDKDMVKSANAHKWGALMATSFVVMVSSSRLWKTTIDDICNVDDNLDICRRTQFAIALGAISGITCVMIMLLGHKSGDMVESMVSLAAIIAWSFGASYITFGNGPGKMIGNLFFSTWGSFGVSMTLAADAIQFLMGKCLRNETQGEADAKHEDQKKSEEDDPMPEADGEDTHVDQEEGSNACFNA